MNKEESEELCEWKNLTSLNLFAPDFIMIEESIDIMKKFQTLIN